MTTSSRRSGYAVDYGDDGRVRVPADIDRPDQLIAGLTGRQAAILAACVAVLWLAWQATRALVPPLVFTAAAAPVLALGAVVALGRRDGLPLDQYVLAAWRHARTPRRRVHAPEGVAPVPAFIDAAFAASASAGDDGSSSASTQGPGGAGGGGGRSRKAPAMVTPVPAAPVADGIDAQGVVDLGRDGASLLAAVGTVNFALRTTQEQQALIGAFGAWLNSLPGPVQILVRADRADLAPLITSLRHDAPGLPHPALETAARRHADFLADLAATRDLLHRQVLLAHHDTHPINPGAVRQRHGAAARAQRAPTPLARLGSLFSPPAGRTAGPGRAPAAGRPLHRRAEDSARMLAGADVAATTLDGPAISALLAASCHPAPSHPVPGHVEAHLLAGGIRPGLGGGMSPGRADPAGTRRATWLGQIDSAGLTPQSLQLGAQSLAVAGEHVATFAVTGYPAEVGPGWLEPLLTYPGRLDVAVHIEPVSPVVAAERLRKQRARLESSRRLAEAKGRLQDPELEASADDATDLAYAVARGQTRLFRVGIYLTVHAPDSDTLHDAVGRVRALAESLLLRIEPATWRTVQGWVTTLPLGVDALKLRRTLDTGALAAAFPFVSSDLPAADPVRPGRLSGLLYGVNATSPGLVVWDRWSQDNYNSVVLARSGAGKSYLTKLDVLRSLYTGVHVAVIDPEDEYTRLAHAVGGTVLALGRPGVRLNPLDLPPTHAATADGSGSGAVSIGTG